MANDLDSIQCFELPLWQDYFSHRMIRQHLLSVPKYVITVHCTEHSNKTGMLVFKQ